MNISWQSIDEYTQTVYVEGVNIGEVRSTLLTQQWSIYPNFWSGKAKQDTIYKKYPSSYLCGKAMAELYADSYDYGEDPWVQYGLDDEDFDLKGVFGSIKP
jgi:hypothetical protein